MADNKSASGTNRDKYSDYDDERVVLHDDEPAETKPGSKSASRSDGNEAASAARRTAPRKRVR